MYNDPESEIKRRRLTKVEAGFVRPGPEKEESPVGEDRFCCQTCVHFVPEKGGCSYVEGDIRSTDCCNWWTDEEIPIEECETGFYNQGPGKYKVPAGILGSKEAHAILNGYPIPGKHATHPRRRTRRAQDDSECVLS